MKLATAYIIILVSLFTYGHKHEQPVIRNVPAKAEAVVIPKEDTRVEKVKIFLSSYNSPLAPYAEEFVEASDKNGYDYRILPAIALIESTGGKFTPSCAPYNPFGWSSTTSPCGFYRFESFEEAIRIVGDKIGNGKYYARFQQTKRISELAYVYNENPEDWTFKLEYFMERI